MLYNILKKLCIFAQSNRDYIEHLPLKFEKKMKKLVLFAAVAVAISFASCSNKSNADASNNADTTAVAEETVVEEVVAPVADDSAVIEEVTETVVEEAPAN